MKAVTIDPDARTADVQGGATAGDLIEAAQKYGLATTTGTVYCGAITAGEQIVAPLRTFGEPLVDQVQPVTYNALIHGLDAMAPKGRHYYMQTRSLKGLQAETITSGRLRQRDTARTGTAIVFSLFDDRAG